MKNLFTSLLVVMMFLFSGQKLHAVQPDEVLSDPILEERARILSKELRCMVCQNQSIDDSDASLARDLRVLIRDRLTKGDTNTEVIDYVVGRYGEFVLLKPAFKPHTYVLWIGPFVILLLGVFGVCLIIKRQKHPQRTDKARPLTAKEKAALKKLLK